MKVKCGTCGSETEAEFKDACENGCPVCGSGDIEVYGEE